MDADAVRPIADAVLYEGYVLWPYRKSAMKNQRRWTFGGVYPQAHSARHEDDACVMQTQCLLEGEDKTRIEVWVRCLHVVERQVLAIADGRSEPVEELAVDDERYVSWDEAVEREHTIGPLALGEVGTATPTEISIAAGSQQEELEDSTGRHAGAVVRSWRALHGTIDLEAQQLEPGLHKVTVRISNTSPWEDGSREDALRQTFCSTHTVLHTADGAFVSLTDPPANLADAAAACQNEGTWPVLVGDAPECEMLLSSPIILSDYPQVAPESPGDLFDGGEIDQMLVHNILSMTDEEKREMREADPRTREILERTEALSEEELMRLHGRIREFGLAR